MSSLPNQISETTQVQWAKQYALYDSLSRLAFRGFERLINLQMMTAKDVLTNASTVDSQPPVEKLIAFSHEVAMMSADMQNEFLQVLRTAQPGEVSSVQLTFDRQPFNLPHFSLFSTLFTLPNEASANSAIETVIFKEAKKTPPNKIQGIKQSKPKVTITQTPAPSKAKISDVKKPDRKLKTTQATTSKTETAKPALAETVQKTVRTSEAVAPTARQQMPIKPSFPSVQLRNPLNKAPKKK